MARAHFVRRARKCPQRGSGIYKGDSYWWWKFKSRVKGVETPKIVSKTPPKRSQLTRSPFYKTVYDLEDGTKSIKTLEEATEYVESAKESLEGLKEQCQESLEALPENFRESSSSAGLLQERIDGLSEWLSNLEGVDLSDHTESEPDEDGEESELVGGVDIAAIIQAIQDCNPGSF